MPEKPRADYLPALSAVPGSSSITPEERARAIAYLRYYLNNPQGNTYGVNRGNSTRQYNKGTNGDVMTGLQDDPQADLAIINLLKQYPHIAKNIASTLTGAPLSPGVQGQIDSNITSGGGNIRLAPHPQNNMSVWDTMRHEMAHAIGYRDSGPAPDAYDIGRASEDLHRDIQLPGITPPKLVKRKGKK